MLDNQVYCSNLVGIKGYIHRVVISQNFDKSSIFLLEGRVTVFVKEREIRLEVILVLI